MSKFSERVIRTIAAASEPVEGEPRLVTDALDRITDAVTLASQFANLSAGKVAGPKIGPPRASSLLTACIRKHCIGTMEIDTTEEFASLRSRLVFGLGSALHRWVQNTPDVLGDARVGWWRCLACGTRLYFGLPPRKRCRVCNASTEAIQYDEHHMRLRGEFELSGHPDMFVPFHGRVIRVMELKSINGKEFATLVAPFAAHEVQVCAYMWGLGRDTALPTTYQVDGTVGYVTYLCKKHLAKEFPIKIFQVRMAPATRKLIVNACASYKSGLVDYPANLPPPQPECLKSDFGNYTAKFCPAVKKCAGYYHGA